MEQCGILKDTSFTTTDTSNGKDYYDGLLKAIRTVNENYQAVAGELKLWQTNYNNLLAEFEEVSAIAQQQEQEIDRLREEIKELAKALYYTWDNVCWEKDIPDFIKLALDRARAIVHGGE